MRTSLKIFLLIAAAGSVIHAGGCYTSSALSGDVPDISWRDDGSPTETVETEPDPVDLLPDLPVIDIHEGPEDRVPEDIIEEMPEEEPPPAVVLWSDDYEGGEIEWTYQQGDWALADGKLAQSTDMMSELWYPALSWRDFAAEVSVMAEEIDPVSPRAVVGIIFRAQSIDPNNYYLCAIDFNHSVLIMYRYDSVAPGYHNLCSSSEFSTAVSMERWYKIQVFTSGTSLVCRAVLEDVALAEISAHDDFYLAGGIGLYTNKASAQFDDLIVWDRRPDDWPAADHIEACP
jgi:hypothetical protein